MAKLSVPSAIARSKMIACLSALWLSGFLGAPSLAAEQTASPPLPAGPPHEATAPSGVGGITAVVVKSWDGGGASAWQELNNEWPLYGDIPIFIDTTTLGNVDFTFQDLVDTGADVVILSDVAGGVQQYSPSEIDAISSYASIGHNVLGTFLTFQWGDSDNRDLAPVFGLRSDLTYNKDVNVGISNVFNVIDVGNPLFQGLPDPWNSEGYPETQTPSEDLRWDAPDLAGAELVAQSDDFKAMISVYDGGPYTGLYVSNMPEYFGGSLDKQLLYNAITYPRPCVGRLTLDKSEVRSGERLEYTVYLKHNRLDPVMARLSVRVLDSLGATRWERNSKPMSFEYGDEVQLRDSLVIPATVPPGSYLWAVAMDLIVYRRTTTKPFEVVP